MSLEEVAAIFGLILVWDTLFVQVFFLPFFNKGEDLHKNYEQSGILEAAIASIETTYVTPTLARMFFCACRGQEDRRRRLTEEELQQLLNQAGYAEDLRSATHAMQQAHSVQLMFSRLQESSDRIWKWALLHVVTVLIVPIAYWLDERYKIYAVAGVAVIAVLSLLMTTATAFGFHSVRRAFLKALQRKRESTQ